MTTKTLQNISVDSIAYRNGRFSGFIRPISYFVDLSLIILAASNFFKESFDLLTYSIFIGICWVIVSMQLDFYRIRRNTKFTTLLNRLAKQSVFFAFVVFAFFGYYYELNRESAFIFNYIAATLGGISILKIGLFFILKNYRSALGGNFRNIAILGKNKDTQQLYDFFTTHTDLGYRSKDLVNVGTPSFSLAEFKQWVIEEKIDEIFCSVQELNNDQLLELTDFADNNLRTLKFIPDTETILSKQLRYDYYGLTPVLSLREIPLDDMAHKFTKRAFDILFSLFIIIGVMSWLTPLVAIIIKMESKGPVFFKQARNGLDYREFICFKFRSMVPNNTAHLHQVKRGDHRITKIGRFLRKTSIDELPQFFNVLLGDMSVVGPRPHLESLSLEYQKDVDYYLKRHIVKPGITGLAQVSGYRGEIKRKSDIKNRVRLDIFYIENWSFLFDIKIIIKTILNIFTGEEKAY